MGNDNNNSKERIAKVIARAGICSRRDAEKLILNGDVSVNGEVLTTPAFLVSKDDNIVVNGTPIGKADKTRVWRYHKPCGLVTTHKDEKGRPTVFENLPSYLPRVISIGRLDLNSEGLLLLTNDGEFARKLEMPSSGWSRKYRVRIHGTITDEIISKLAKGVIVENVKYSPAFVSIDKVQNTNTWITITLTEGKNREIRKLMEFFGLKVTRLIRISYGPFQLGNLPEGEVSEISGKVIAEQLGSKL
ncbi:MAG: rRNA pseudouridine synthase [Alphaproteobacteria bacterium]|nr:rRNA pseudouridine synthase [Alphaproteobacteria bacterium]